MPNARQRRCDSIFTIVTAANALHASWADDGRPQEGSAGRHRSGGRYTEGGPSRKRPSAARLRASACVAHALCVCVLLQAESEMEKLERQALEEANAHGQAHEPADIDGSARPGAAPALNPEEVRPCVRVCAGTATASRAST
jgi:hypothetical protein